MRTVREIVIHSFHDIQPINAVEEGLKRGRYSSHYQHITNQTVPIQPAVGAKTLCLIHFDLSRILGTNEHVELLRGVGKRPCHQAPAYLLGLMKQVPEEKMPKAFLDKNIVAAEPDNRFSVFLDRNGKLCFLFVNRCGHCRRLNLARIDGGYGERWAFLAEDLTP